MSTSPDSWNCFGLGCTSCLNHCKAVVNSAINFPSILGEVIQGKNKQPCTFIRHTGVRTQNINAICKIRQNDAAPNFRLCWVGTSKILSPCPPAQYAMLSLPKTSFIAPPMNPTNVTFLRWICLERRTERCDGKKVANSREAPISAKHLNKTNNRFAPFRPIIVVCFF